ncbi:hypothetical protein [Acidimangrovimonas pyrenivorans]|uniref:Uncharacterized protein n=1 Tax=Acidimangrovimonas pyrenivorans TaxID=2030798 RepID=A0ABV7ALP0_9RHOB
MRDFLPTGLSKIGHFKLSIGYRVETAPATGKGAQHMRRVAGMRGKGNLRQWAK